MRPPQLFVFAHRWVVPAPPDDVYAALADIERYPRWWPQVRAVVPGGPDSVHAVVRSVLPYRLRLDLTRELADPADRHLRVGLDGDLRGWMTCDITAGQGGSVVAFAQECVVTPALLTRLARPLAPLLRANHAHMMSAGRRGLAAYLAPPA